MGMVSSEQLTAKDIQKYKPELLRHKEFNELNEDLYGSYMKSSLFNKIQYKAGARIIFYEDLPVMIIWSETRNYNVKVRTIIPLESMDTVSQKESSEIMEIFRNSLPLHLDIQQFEYQVVRNEQNDEILSRMGFLMRRGILLMSLQTDDVGLPEHMVQTRKFHIEDIKARVDIQNIIFDNKYRVPINSADVLIEVSKKSYIPDLSFFYMKNESPIGYGQINTHDNRFYLVNFGLIPEYRGQGLSRDFLLTIIEKAKERGIDRIFLEVNADNISAVNLYRSIGFKEEQNTCTWLYYNR